MRKAAAILAFVGTLLQGQDLSEYRNRYDHFEENDTRAFEYLNSYIAKAKAQQNFTELAQAYKDAVNYAPESKLRYADSMIMAAARAGDRDLIASAYLTKGTVYYFNYRKFQPALDEYLKAWNFASGSKDEYLYFKNLYHIGVVKSYLGYWPEAWPIFEKCRSFFGRGNIPAELPNLRFNRQKGYLNSLHQAATCLLEMSQEEQAAALADKGLEASRAAADFYLERAYFYKLKGIIAYKKGQDKAALAELSTALPGILRKNDFTNATVIYFYKGKSLERLGKRKEAVANFVKVDSVFRQYNFILPQVREMYEILIKDANRSGDRPLELYYTTQLLKADRILAADFKYLSGRIHKEFDTAELLAAKKRLEHSVSDSYVMAVLLVTAVLILAVSVHRRRVYERALKAKYEELKLQMQMEKAEKKRQTAGRKPVQNRRIGNREEDLLIKLAEQEEKCFFLEKGLTLNTLSITLGTNPGYLSSLISTHKGIHFKDYLNRLRIRYVRDMLYDSRQWRRYSVETLAKECGFADRTKFSRAFRQETGVSPVEFIRKREEELDG